MLACSWASGTLESRCAGEEALGRPELPGCQATANRSASAVHWLPPRVPACFSIIPLQVLHQPGTPFAPTRARSGMGGGTDGTPSLLVGLAGRSPDRALHADVTTGSLLLAISGPGVEAVPLTARGMRCISQVGGSLGMWLGVWLGWVV